MKKIILALACIFIGCGSQDQYKAACDHIEGYGYDECNAGDDFSPLTCVTALEQFESWWRSDAQAAVNHCLASTACYSKANETPGPSIQIPLQVCLSTALTASLQPTDAQTKAISRFCVKAAKCNELEDYTIAGCEEVLLNPYDDGPLFLMMNDQVANTIADCDKQICDNFDGCVIDSLSSAGVFGNMNGVSIKMPAMMIH